jgi:hypothetical protein
LLGAPVAVDDDEHRARRHEGLGDLVAPRETARECAARECAAHDEVHVDVDAAAVTFDPGGEPACGGRVDDVGALRTGFIDARCAIVGIDERRRARRCCPRSRRGSRAE